MPTIALLYRQHPCWRKYALLEEVCLARFTFCKSVPDIAWHTYSYIDSMNIVRELNSTIFYLDFNYIACLKETLTEKYDLS